MSKRCKDRLFITLILFLIFSIFTAAVMVYDVRPIGPEGSRVGMAGLNEYVFDLFGGFHESIYEITMILGYLPLGIVGIFGLLGLSQLVSRRSFRKVDPDILVLGAFYLIVGAIYLAFTKITINCRPVLIDGMLEASYPSSHTIMAICVMLTAMMQLNYRVENPTVLAVAQILCMALMAAIVVGRFLAGEHWVTDIIGGILISAALVMLYSAVISIVDEKLNEKY